MKGKVRVKVTENQPTDEPRRPLKRHASCPPVLSAILSAIALATAEALATTEALATAEGAMLP